ncbi:outer membrane beta-barrel protein [Aliarcobacter lanthieri]|uniref:outer membrane beta-barrel protein n=2 Tax=Aliarcobacter lanthieri TaxID=1355374 RepID=UPI003AA7D660
MKKISGIVAGLMLASSSAMAVDIEYFIGAGAEYSKSEIESSGNGDSSKFDSKDTAFKLKSGVILDKTHRISLSYSKPSDNLTWVDEFDGSSGTTKASTTLILANYDYFFPITEDFRLGVGAHLGSAKLELKEEGEKWSKSGLAYGVQLSAIYDITKNVEFEIGVGHTRYNVDIKHDDGFKDELKYTTSGYAGVNFKF